MKKTDNNSKNSEISEIDKKDLEKITKNLLRLVQDYEYNSRTEMRKKVKDYINENLK